MRPSWSAGLLNTRDIDLKSLTLPGMIFLILVLNESSQQPWKGAQQILAMVLQVEFHVAGAVQ